MFRENDSPENPAVRPGEQAQECPNEAAKRRLMEFSQDQLDCGHSEARQAEEAAVEQSGRLISEWDEANPEKNRYLLEGVGREMMRVHEAPPPPIHSVTMGPAELGSHCDSDFKIELNKDLLSQEGADDALKVYLHEYRHAEQHYEVAKSHGALRHTVEIERSADLELNIAHYIEPPADFTQPEARQAQAAYEGQILEADANSFANDMTERIIERMEALRERTVPEPPSSGDANRIASHRLGPENKSSS